MNIQQLRYLVALDEYRHFAQAAEACHVSQPTLSAMVQKFEEEQGVKIFNRKPIYTTVAGAEIVAQARRILHQVGALQEIIQSTKNELTGTLHLGVIPTVAPYLLPDLLLQLQQHHPQIRLTVEEHTTANLMDKLLKGQLEAAILSDFPAHKYLQAEHLYDEDFVLYTTLGSLPEVVTLALLEQIPLWLLEEGHCLRTQITQLCGNSPRAAQQVNYLTGSLYALQQIVERCGGATILPQRAIAQLSPLQRRGYVRRFTAPAPQRAVFLVHPADALKRRLLQVIQQAIRQWRGDGAN